jgi:ribosome modulation factor
LSDIRNVLRSGYDAYYAAYSTGFFGADHRPQWIPNPHNTNPNKDLWLRGWREAEKAFNLRGQYLQNLPFETVPGLRDAARYHEAKARGKAQKRPTTKSPVFAAPYGKQTPAKPKGGVNLGKLNRFAKKHRTVA